MTNLALLSNGDVSYYLRDGYGDNKIIQLKKKDNCFTAILGKNSQDLSKEDQYKILKEIVGNARIVNLSQNKFQVVLLDHNSSEEIDSLMDIIRKKKAGIIVSHAYAMKRNEKSVFYLTDKIMIGLDENLETESAATVIGKLKSKYHLDNIKQYKVLKNAYLLELTEASKENPIKIANKIETEKNVKYAEPSLIRTPVESFAEVAKQKPAKKSLQGLSQRQWYLDSIELPDAWNAIGSKGNKDIVIAIIDKYFFVDHPAFAKKIKNKSFDFVTPGDPFQFSDILNDHGTSCAGLLAADSDRPLMSGVAPGCTLLPARVDAVLQDDQLLECGEAIGPLADIISCSWATEPSDFTINRTLRDMISELAKNGGPRNKGCIFCFSAGNFNVPINEEVNNLAFIDSNGNENSVDGACVNPFASHPDVVAVAACTKNNKKAHYSNYGNEISVCAPGSDVLPDQQNQTQNLINNWVFTTAAKGEILDGDYTNKFGGTSSATAIVAGVAALILSVNNKLTAREVKEILQSSAEKINSGNRQLATSAGKYIDNGNAAGSHSKWFGYGKVNAKEAVKLAANFKN